MAKRKKGQQPTTLVRISRECLERLRAESKKTGVPLRVLGDRAVAAFLESRPGA